MAEVINFNTSKLFNTRQDSSIMAERVDREIESIDIFTIRAHMENFVDNLISESVLSIDSFNNKLMRDKIIDRFMESEKLKYTLHGQLVCSMFENVVRTKIVHVPEHSHIDLDKYFRFGFVIQLSDEDYVHQYMLLERC